MSRKARFNKDEILKTAYDLFLQGGMENVTTHNLALELGCSTQPIYTYLKNMDNIRKHIMNEALSHEGQYKEDNEYGLIRFAEKEPKAFQLLNLNALENTDNISVITFGFACHVANGDISADEAIGRMERIKERLGKDI